MNQYKFRGKCTKTDRWVYGDLLQRKDSFGKLYLIDVQDDEPPFEIETHHVYPESVGMWTGLKDKSGNEIYNSDIIESRGGLTVYVAWEGERAMFIYKNNYGFTAIFSGGDFVTVIGNLYDNPELVNPASGQSGINNMFDPNEKQATEEQVKAVEQEAQEQAMESEKGGGSEG